MFKHISICLFVFFQFSFHVFCQSKYYVNDNSSIGDIYCSGLGSDGNNGTHPSSPKATISNLLLNYTLVGGDTVFIDVGTYTGSPIITPTDKGSGLNAYLVFKGADSSKTIFTTSTTKYNIWINRSDFLWFEGISFVSTYSGGSSDSTFNILKNYGKSTVIRNCKFDIQGASARPSRNIFMQCNLNTDLDMQRTLISRNRFLNSRPSGIAIFGLGDVDNSRFELNKIEMSGASSKGIVFSYIESIDESPTGGATGHYWPVSDTVFKNNISCFSTGLDYNSIAIPPIFPNPASSRSRSLLVDHVVESNSITINSNAAKNNSAIYLKLCGSNDKSFRILKNRLMNGYSGIYIENGVQNLVVQNNYICSNYGLYHEQANTDTDPNTIGFNLDNDNNQFVHNSVYTNLSCLYFIGSIINGFTSGDWDIRNNILYTKNTNSTSVCINFQSVSSTTSNTSENMRWCNSNLFYNDVNTNVVRIGVGGSGGFYNLSNWSSAGLSDSIYVINDGPPDANSLFAKPKWDNVLNCDLDLIQDPSIWPNSYPNWNYLDGTGNKFIYQNLTSTDIRDIPSRSFWTIGAFDAASPTTLPVHLQAFNARLNNQRVLLDWQTASEQNADYFNVEKSKDGQSGWIFVARVQSRGNSSARADYQAIDHRPYGGVSYYRLKQVDQDGRVAYSQTRKIINDTKTITVYPNPAKDHAVIEGLDKNRSNMIHLLDITGKLLAEYFVKDSQYRLDLTNLAPGVYHVVVNASEHFQLVKTK